MMMVTFCICRMKLTKDFCFFFTDLTYINIAYPRALPSFVIVICKVLSHYRP